MANIITAIISKTITIAPITIPAIAPEERSDDLLSLFLSSSFQLQRYLFSQAYISFTSVYSKSIIVISLSVSFNQ